MNTRILLLASLGLVASGATSAIGGTCTTEIDTLSKALAAKDAGSGPTIGAPEQRQEQTSKSQHPPTAVMGQETLGKATSPEDVRRQTQGEPTAAEQGATGRTDKTDKMDQANASLQRARALDAQGKDPECMEAVQRAKDLAGSVGQQR